MKSPIFELSNISQIYNDRQVLNVEKLSIHDGEILAVVGPSGAGKSTLLRLLNFLENPTTGKIKFSGTSANQQLALEERRRITTVFQRPILLKRTVAANMRYTKNIRGEKFKTGELDQWLNRIGLLSMADISAKKLSEGEAQRVAMARALLMKPDVLLLDEPTANLDPYNVELIEELVRQENKKSGTTIVLVTHNIFQAQRLAHRTALILQGEIVEISKTQKFFNSPNSPKTAAFLQGELVY
jgi:tungstate transport system ATP-binding protein